jgi:hypothetical protein
MNIDLSDALLVALKDFLQLHMGLNFSRRQDRELVQKIGLAANAFG